MNEPDISRFIPRGLTRNQEQIDIQLARHKVLLIEANAGAAKTTTLALRIGEAIANNVAPENILALVFTPTARDVMRQRLRHLGIHSSIMERIDIATFEEFSTKELSKIEDDGVKIYPHARHQKKYMLAAIDKVYERFSHKIESLHLAKHNIAITQFLDAQLSLKAQMNLESDFELDDLETVFDRLGVTSTEYLIAIEYERIRLGYNDRPLFRGPFDATYDLARNLEFSPDISQNFSDYRLIVCDELHDLNEAAFRILGELVNRPRCFFVGAGDKDQVIHSTLGASYEFLSTRFKQAFPSVKRYPLTITYRHGPHLAYPMHKFKDKDIESHLAHRTEVNIDHYDGTAEDCARRVVESIKKWKRDGFSFDDCAILMRDRHQSVVIENALRVAQIGYRTPVMASYLQREEILFLRGVMAIALSDLTSVKFYEVRSGIVEALAIFGDVVISAPHLEKAKYDIAKDPHLIWGFYERYIRRDESTGPTNLLDHTIKYVLSVASDARADMVLREICMRMNLEATARQIYIRPYDARVVAKSIAGFLSVATKSEQLLSQFWQTLNSAETFANKKRDKDAVTLDCVANSKGKEFAHVIMPFLETDEFPSPMFKLEEEENLFYVGATRTKSRLTLIVPSDKDRRSPFVARMSIERTAARADLAVARNESMFRAPQASRHYLKSIFEDGPLLKSMGAKFDWTRKAWYVEVGTDLQPFSHWL